MERAGTRLSGTQGLFLENWAALDLSFLSSEQTPGGQAINHYFLSSSKGLFMLMCFRVLSEVDTSGHQAQDFKYL